MLTKESKIAMIGAGAIGGVTAAFIRLSGPELEIICNHQDTADKIFHQGIHITGVKGEHCVQMKAVKNISDLSEPKDLVFVATKATDCVAAAKDLLPFLKPDSVAMKIKVEPAGAGKLDYYKLLEGKTWLANFKRHLTIRIIGYKYRHIKSSSLQSIERGRRTEVDFLNGYICARGRELGVTTPLNDALREMVHEIEDGKRKMSLRNVGDPVFETR